METACATVGRSSAPTTNGGPTSAGALSNLASHRPLLPFRSLGLHHAQRGGSGRLIGTRPLQPGGEHADGLTRNALVPFGDGSYFELVTFLNPEDTGDNVWGWRGFLPREGLIDYCVASDDLGSDVRRLESLGFGVDGPDDGGRRLPDGTEIRWRSARMRQEGRILPFLIEDLTPRELRVPGASAAEHPNGATGISRLEISAPDAEEAATSLSALVDARDGTGTSVRLGACALSPEATEKEDAAPGPLAVELVGESESSHEFDPLLAHGIRIRIQSR